MAALPSFSSARKGIESGAPFRLHSNGFVLAELTEEEKLIVRDAMVHGPYLRLIIRTEEEIQFFGEVLRLHQKLKHLMVHFRFANQTGIDYFAEILKQTNLTKLTLIRSRYVEEDNLCKVFEALHHIMPLIQLRISIFLLPEEQMPLVEILSKEGLEEMEFETYNDDPGAEFEDATWLRIGELLSRHHSLKTINWELLTPAACTALGGALKTNTTLKTLHIQSSSIQPDGMMRICEGLKQNSTLYDLKIPGDLVPNTSHRLLFESLANNYIKVRNVVLKSAPLNISCIRILSESLKTNTLLESLDLTETHLDADTCQVLCHGLKHNKTLKTLKLCNNNIGLIGVQEISTLLKENTPLQYLDLTQCLKSDDEQFRMLAEGLKCNRTLKTLLIPRNEMSSKGCAYICGALKTNLTLSSLDLTYNSNFGHEGLISIRNMLIDNTTLRELDIGDCFQSSVELALLCEAFKINQSLNALTAYSSEGISSEEFEEKIVEAFQCNYALTKFASDCQNDKTDDLMKRNLEMKSEMAYKVAILSRNIARSKEAIDLLPREIWIWIMKQIRHPGVVNFDKIIDTAFYGTK